MSAEQPCTDQDGPPPRSNATAQALGAGTARSRTCDSVRMQRCTVIVENQTHVRSLLEAGGQVVHNALQVPVLGLSSEWAHDRSFVVSSVRVLATC